MSWMKIINFWRVIIKNIHLRTENQYAALQSSFLKMWSSMAPCNQKFSAVPYNSLRIRVLLKLPHDANVCDVYS